jgi:hydroxyacylglutathione hydrolase
MNLVWIWLVAAEADVEDPTIDFAEVRRRIDTEDIPVLDVRYASEHATMGRVPDAQNIAHTRLRLRLGEVPKDRPLIVHCEAGGRSGLGRVAASDARYEVIAVEDNIANWSVREAAAAAG